jgi:hypothetical protein
MKTLYLDCFSGISGDMFLGLLLDLGVDRQQLEAALDKLELPGFCLEVGREQRHGIDGCRVQVQCDEQTRHRHWREIDRMLARSGLDSGPKQLAQRLFRRLGEAEARVHGIALEEVHFHEVGALDAIVDLVGAAVGLHLLAPEQVICSPLPLSRGLGRCAHGALPLPAPATLELLRGAPICASGIDQELVTPTGAAIAAEIADFGPLPELRIERIGYGVGDRQLPDRPNLLRGLLGAAETASLPRDQVQVLESHIDDASPELLGELLDRLMAAGALDAGYTPLQMKKNRPGVRLTLICEPRLEQQLARLVLRESSAIGIRSYQTGRFKLHRQPGQVTTPLGSAAVKLLYDGDELLRISPEFADCRRLSRATGTPLPEVYRQVAQAAGEQLSDTKRDDPSS